MYAKNYIIISEWFNFVILPDFPIPEFFTTTNYSMLLNEANYNITKTT